MDATQILTTYKLKKTAGRLSFIKALLESDTPMSEQEIKAFMEDDYDRISFFRNAHTLANAGIIHRIVTDGGVKYAISLNKGVNSHIHFQCIKCGKVQCIESQQPYGYKLPAGFTQSDCEVLVKGYCDSCNDQSELSQKDKT